MDRVQDRRLQGLALLSALGVGCSVLVIRWDMAAIREDQAADNALPH